MANHPSAEKRNRQRIVRTARNRQARSALRTALRKARAAIASGDKAAAAEQVRTAESVLARAAQKGLIHKKAAARTTSRIAAQFAKLG